MSVLVPRRDFDLGQIAASGQCFRLRPSVQPDGAERFDILSARRVVRALGAPGGESYEFLCSAEEFDAVWRPYFDLDTDYAACRAAIRDDPFLAAAAACGCGMRILRQDWWEALVTFVLSQNSNIPRIRACVERFCEAYGPPVRRYGETFYGFPDAFPPDVTEEDLRALGFGYRAAYVQGLIRAERGSLLPRPGERASEALRRIPGVGPKVAACAALFGFHEMDAYPVDVWVRRMLERYYGGAFDTAPYRGFEGYIQQLQFFYIRTLEGK